jgi:type II secretory pathway pseudopilin PulG
VPRAGGFTYLLLLVFVAIFGFALAAAAQVWATLSKREKEQELVFALGQFHGALLLYSRGAAPPQQSPVQPPPPIEAMPKTLEDLLQDPRAPDVRRYLRRIYVDPMTGKAEWGLVQRQGRIIGVYSLSEEAPVGRTYALANIDFEKAQKYSDWRVVVIPTAQGGLQGAAPADSPSSPGGAMPAATPPLTAAQPSATPAKIPPPAPPLGERPTTTDRDLNVMSDQELNQYCTQLNLLDIQACAASKTLKPLSRMECMKTASARQSACMLRQNDLPPLYLSDR